MRTTPGAKSRGAPAAVSLKTCSDSEIFSTKPKPLPMTGFTLSASIC